MTRMSHMYQSVALKMIVLASLAVPSTSLAQQASSATTAEGSEKKTVSFWMEKKLDYTKQILGGLATGDYASIRENAHQMRLLGKVEGFVRRRNDEYRTQLRIFDRVSYEIGRQAEEENLEGVALAFNMLTVNCINCHKLIRADEDPQVAADDD